MNHLIDVEIDQMLLDTVDSHRNLLGNKNIKLPNLKIDTESIALDSQRSNQVLSAAMSNSLTTSMTPSLIPYNTYNDSYQIPHSAPILQSLPFFNFDYNELTPSISIGSPMDCATAFEGGPFTFSDTEIRCHSDGRVFVDQTNLTNIDGKVKKRRPKASPLDSVHSSSGWPSLEVQKNAYQSAKSGSTQIKCEFPGCDRVFNRLQNLKSHWRCHSDDKPFVCDDCGQSFRRLPDLYRHRRSLHNDGKPHTCTGCGKEFARSDALRRHIQVRNGKGGCGTNPVINFNWS